VKIPRFWKNVLFECPLVMNVCKFLLVNGQHLYQLTLWVPMPCIYDVAFSGCSLVKANSSKKWPVSVLKEKKSRWKVRIYVD